MYLKSIHIENYRLLKDVVVPLDRSLTLFVGKNNTGKTSIMQAIEFLLTGSNTLPFNDYPLDCRQKLYSSIVNYWRSQDENPISSFRASVPITRVLLTIDYSDDIMGNVSEFVIDLDESISEAVIRVSFDLSTDIESVLESCRKQFDLLIDEDASDRERDNCLRMIVKNHFTKFFMMNIVAVNPANPEDTLIKKKSDLQNLFYLKVIRAERNMDESEKENSNPLGKIMKSLFSSELDETESDIQESIVAIQEIVSNSNYTLQGRINEHMAEIVQSMMPFGYPAADDMRLYANTNIDLQRSISEDTELTYRSHEASESLPGSHNGLGYKNLIKISLELHEFVRTIKGDKTRLPLLFLEEPEAHMHPQLQTTFVSYIENFLLNVVGEKTTQIMITTHSAHVANTVQFEKVRYIRRYDKCIECKPVTDFPTIGDRHEQAERLDFLQKYMKLSYCDLYFCDKAILVEGASERLLLPDMIRKCEEQGDFDGVDIPLTSQYYSIIEVGGAYAHRFYDFLDYLEIPTLVITDIDFVKGTHNNACSRDEAEKSSNGAINRWCRKALGIANGTVVTIDQILGLYDEQLTDGFRHLAFEKEENGFHPRSFEDAIMNCNREKFNIADGINPDFNSRGEKKTDFALKLLVEDEYADYNVPSYIREGLVWLNGQSRTGGYQND